MQKRYSIGLIGAGGISEIHARLLTQNPATRVAAVVDRDLDRARHLAQASGAERVLDDAAKLLEAPPDERVDAVHVLVPPHLHADLAVPFLEAGVHVLCEKPMAPSVADCERMQAAAERGGARLAVNHNLLFDPAYLNLRSLLKSGQLGPLRHLDFAWSVPLPPLAMGRFGAWMFHEARHMVFEQGVHPLSLLCDLGGVGRDLRTLHADPRPLTDELEFVDRWQVSLQLERCSAQLFLAFGEALRVTTLSAICEDGVARADLVNGRLIVERRRPTELAPGVRDGLAQGSSLIRQSLGRGLDALLKPLGLRPDPDPFAVSMAGSLGHFYETLGQPVSDPEGRFGAELVRLCEEITADVPARERVPPAPAVSDPGPCDVVLLGGTGVIGRILVRHLVQAGLRVRVMARGMRGLGPVFRHERVQLVAGSAESPEDLARALRGAASVVDLFYVTEGADVDTRMVESAERIARACLAEGVQRLIYLSSTAALYLGDPTEVIRGSTPADPRSELRSAYSRGKALSEVRLAELHRSEGLPVCILRPGIVVGEGGVALHPGMGRVVDEQHCIGWGDGKNPMAFVLVDDVAEGIRLALEAQGVEGRTYNLVGAVPLSAREYVAALGEHLGRPLVYLPQPLWWFQSVEIGKWILKRLAGRRDAELPSLRDSRSRAMYARFDLSDAQADLGWRPESDRAAFLRRAIGVHPTSVASVANAAHADATSGT